MSKLLNALGLMKRSEHEAVEQDRDDWRDKSMEQSVEISELTAKFKLASTDLAKQAEEIKGARQAIEYWKSEAVAARNEANALRPYALKWRDYLKRSRDRKEAKKGVSRG